MMGELNNPKDVSPTIIHHRYGDYKSLFGWKPFKMMFCSINISYELFSSDLMIQKK